MYIRSYLDAFRRIHAAIDLGNPTAALQLFATASALYRDMAEEADKIPETERSGRYGYTLEKFDLWLNDLRQAILPHPNSHRSPAEWLKSAHDNLSKVGCNWSGENW